MRQDITREVLKGVKSSTAMPVKKRKVSKTKREIGAKRNTNEESKYLTPNQIKNLPENLKSGIIKRKKAAENKNNQEKQIDNTEQSLDQKKEASNEK